MKPASWLLFALFGGGAVLLGGCDGDVTITLPGDTEVTIPLGASDTVIVEIFNDTDFEVAPRIRFDADTDWLAAAFAGEELSTGILAPGDLNEYTMACDRVGVIFSDTAGQFLGDETIGQADTTAKLRRGKDFDCGDTLQFHFIGGGDGFGVIVSINDVVVD